MKRMTSQMCVVALFGAVSVPAMADVIGFTGGASAWWASNSGDLTAGSTYDLEGNLGLDSEAFYTVHAAFEHPVPFLPNVKLQYHNMAQSGTGTVANSTFLGQTFAGGIEADVDLSHIDGIFYYEVLDNWVNIDVGLNFKVFNGEVEVQEQGGLSNASRNIDEFIPLLYANVALDLPFTGLSVGVEASALAYDDNEVYDAALRLRQNLSVAYAELGYRQLAISLDNVNSIGVDAEMSGPYLSVGVDF